MGGSEKLEERLAFRPTSETMFCDHWHNVLQSYRELPMLYNQWCSVIRWEKTTRPFLRSREFWLPHNAGLPWLHRSYVSPPL